MADVIEDTEGLIMLVIFGGVALLMFGAAKKFGLVSPSTPGGGTSPNASAPGSPSGSPSAPGSSTPILDNFVRKDSATGQFIRSFLEPVFDSSKSWNDGSGQSGALAWGAVKEFFHTLFGNPDYVATTPSPIPDSSQVSSYQFLPEIVPIDATDAWSSYAQQNPTALAEWAQNNLQGGA